MAVVQSNIEKGYRLATKQGIPLGSYTRNQFELTYSLFHKRSDGIQFVMVRDFRSVVVPAKIVVRKIDVNVIKRARYATVVVTQTCLVKINDHNITISYFE